MVEPDDFGLSPAATLAHVADCSPSPLHHAFWKSWRAELDDFPPILHPVSSADADPADPSATHTLRSLGNVRIGARLALPANPRALLILLHDYDKPPSLAHQLETHTPLLDRSLALLALRVRGYPASSLDTGPLISPVGGWIAHGLPEAHATPNRALEWNYPRAIADVVLTCLAARRALNLPIFLKGEGLGADLALAAAAQLARTDPISRIVFAAPALTDWAWQIRHPIPRGVCGDIHRFLTTHARTANLILQTLRIADSCVMARAVCSPVLARLALRDDTVPAPVSAAAYNALGTDPGRKWRFVVPYGHFDGGLAASRRIAQFDTLWPQFLDPALTPAEAMHNWPDVVHAR